MLVVLAVGFGVLATTGAHLVDAADPAVAGAATPDDGDGSIDERASFPTERSEADGATQDSLTLWSAIFVVGTATLAVGGWWTKRRNDRSDVERPLVADRS